NGSGHNGKVGTAAVLLWAGQAPRKLKYHLGLECKHTVYEAEVIGLSLTAQLIATERNTVYSALIFVDNQAAIKSSESQYMRSGGYLVEHFRRMTADLTKQRDDKGLNFALMLRWILGHKDVEGKRAAERKRNTSSREHLPPFLHSAPLPTSTAALRQ
ncbi:hypothetical protein BDR04DRAFT_956330, partial [Suillus decipiens]